MQFQIIEGATPINADEAMGLIPKNILTQNELNEWEQANITKAKIWLSSQKLTIEKFSDIEFIKKFHRKMFDKTWRWAGQFRTSDKNIGCCWTQINYKLKDLCDDLIYQVSHHIFPADELAVRFHVRLVCIHCFANGNGRHARIMTDSLLRILGEKEFSWGNDDLNTLTETRKQYIKALQAVDKGSNTELLAFVRS